MSDLGIDNNSTTTHDVEQAPPTTEIPRPSNPTEGYWFRCQRPPACAPPMVGSCAPPRMCVSRCSRLLSGGLRDRFLLGVGLLSFGWARGVFAGPLPVAFAGYDGHSGVVCESVEGCGGQERIPEYLRPLGG
jgi:hypothetical protein